MRAEFVLAAGAALICVAPFLPRDLRIIELPGILGVPGAALLLALFGPRWRSLGRLTLAVMSFFLSGVVSVTASFVLYLCGVKLDAHSTGPAIGGLSLALLAYAMASTRSGGVSAPWTITLPTGPTFRRVAIGCGCAGLTVAAMVGVSTLSPKASEPAFVAVSLTRSGDRTGQVEDVAPGILNLVVSVESRHVKPTVGSVRVALNGQPGILSRSVAISGDGTQTVPVSVVIPPLQGCDHRVNVVVTVDGHNYAVAQYVAPRGARC